MNDVEVPDLLKKPWKIIKNNKNEMELQMSQPSIDHERLFSSHTKNKCKKQIKQAKSKDQDETILSELRGLYGFVEKHGKIFKKFTYGLKLPIDSFPYYHFDKPYNFLNV